MYVFQHLQGSLVELGYLSAPGIYLPTVPEKIVMAVQKNLTSLKDFLDRNPHIFHLSPSDSAARAPSLEQEAWKVCPVVVMTGLPLTVEHDRPNKPQ